MAADRAFAQTFERGASDLYEKEMLTKTGERLPLSLVLIRYKDGEQSLVAGYLQDLPTQRAAERVLREQSAELERQVRERARESEAARVRAEVLAALGGALQRASTPEQVADLALDTLSPALRAQSMLLVRPDGEGIRLPTLWGDAPGVIVTYVIRPGLRLSETPLLQRVAREGQGLYLDDYRAVPGALASFPSLAGRFEPIYQPDGTLEGFLVVWPGTTLGPWQTTERDLLSRAAGTLGLALKRAQVAAQLAARTRQIEEEARAQEAFIAFTQTVGTETEVVAPPCGPWTCSRPSSRRAWGAIKNARGTRGSCGPGPTTTTHSPSSWRRCVPDCPATRRSSPTCCGSVRPSSPRAGTRGTSASRTAGTTARSRRTRWSWEATCGAFSRWGSRTSRTGPSATAPSSGPSSGPSATA